MKPTETPVYRPTASSIWRSFLTSGKRHLLLTGSRGSGKTTRINQLCAELPGIVTCAVPQTGVYMQEHPHNQRVQIGVYDPLLPGAQNKMRLCLDRLEMQAVPMLRRLTERTDTWVFIDEIGYLESGCEPYLNALRELFAQKRVIAAVRKQDTPFLLELRARSDAFCVDLDAPFGNTGCVVMASGQSKRFGSNKLLADFHGKPMIQRILSATEGIFSRRVVVTRHPEIAECCGGLDVLLHDLPHRSDTVRLGLEAVGAVVGCMFCAADQPLLGQDTIAALALSAEHDRQSIWRLRHREMHGAPVLFPSWTFEKLMHLPTGAGGGYIARMYPEHVRTLPVCSPWELMDADDPKALERLMQIDLTEAQSSRL